MGLSSARSEHDRGGGEIPSQKQEWMGAGRRFDSAQLHQKQLYGEIVRLLLMGLTWFRQRS